MRIDAFIPDTPPAQSTGDGDPGAFARALDVIGNVLSGANAAEDAFAHGSGTLQKAAYERAQADVALSIATATAQRIAQAVQSLLNMQL